MVFLEKEGKGSIKSPLNSGRFMEDAKKVDSLGSGVVDGVFGRKIDGIRSLMMKLLKLLVNFASLAFFFLFETAGY